MIFIPEQQPAGRRAVCLFGNPHPLPDTSPPQEMQAQKGHREGEKEDDGQDDA